MHSFSAQLQIIGINPYLSVPENILQEIFKQAGKSKGSIPIKGLCNGKAYTQTLVRYAGEWRLYINTTMLPQSPKRIGETIDISLEWDPADRSFPMLPELQVLLDQYPVAASTFAALSPSRQKEILRYLGRLKSPEALEKNLQRSLAFLLGKESFAGRKPGE